MQDVLLWGLSRVELWLKGTRLSKAAFEEVAKLIHHMVEPASLFDMHAFTMRSRTSIQIGC